MTEIRSYTNIWKVEKLVYSIQDWHLPRPVAVSTLVWFSVFFILSLLMDGIPPFIFTGNVLANKIAIPALLAWAVGKLRYNGKAPLGVLYSVARYWIRPREMVRGRAVRMEDLEYPDRIITIGERKVKQDGESGNLPGEVPGGEPGL